MSDQQHKAPTDPQMVDLSNGIFNLVISFVQYLTPQVGHKEAGTYVAGYLRRLSDELLALDDTQESNNEEDTNDQAR